MLTATERTRSALYSEAAPWIHSIKTAKHNLEKGDTATTFPTRSQTAPQVIHYMLLQGGIFLPSHDKKKKSAEEETLTLISFLGEKKINKRAHLQHLEQQTHLRRCRRQRAEPWGSTEAGGPWPCPLSQQQAWQCANTPSTAQQATVARRQRCLN